MTDIVERLDGFLKAYPLDIFPEPTAADRKWLERERYGLQGQIAASMARHMGPTLQDAKDIIASQAARIRELEEGLTGARKCMRNAMGAIQSNQVIDKQVDKMLRKGMDAADALLSRKGGEG